MTVRASYFSAEDDARHAIDWTPEWSRRARALPAYAALRSLGKNGLAELVEGCARHARRLVEGIGALDGAEIVFESLMNQGLLRFLAEDGDHDRRTDAVIERIQEAGVTWFGGSTWKGRRVMRVIVLSYRTTSQDVERAIDSVREVVEGFDFAR